MTAEAVKKTRSKKKARLSHLEVLRSNPRLRAEGPAVIDGSYSANSFPKLMKINILFPLLQAASRKFMYK
jgi:hypothetical protein